MSPFLCFAVNGSFVCRMKVDVLLLFRNAICLALRFSFVFLIPAHSMADVLRGSPFEGNGRPARLAHAAAARWMDQLASHQQQQQVERPADRTDSAPPPLLPCVVAAATNDVDFLKANASQLQINASDDQCVYFFSVECDSIALLFDCLFSWSRLAAFFFFSS